MKKFGSFIFIVLSVFLLVSCIFDFGADSVNVTFLVNDGDGTVKTQTIVRGGTVLEPAVTYNGHTLIGWYECDSYTLNQETKSLSFKESGYKFDFSKSVSKDLILVAHWNDGASAQKTVTMQTASFVKSGEKITNSSNISFSTVNTPSGSATSETSVSISAGALTSPSVSESDSEVDLSITAYSISIAAVESSFTVSDSTTKTAVAGIDCTLTIDDTPITKFEGNVTVTTYIAKGLSEPVLKYEVSSGTYEIWDCTASDSSDTNLSVPNGGAHGKAYYYSSTGELVFKTSHFSTFYVEANAEAYIVETNTAYEKFVGAVSSAESGETIKLLKDVNFPIATYSRLGYNELNFKQNVTLDLNSKKITSANGGIVFQGEGLTIKNGTFEAKYTGVDYDSYALCIGNGSKTTSVTVDNITTYGGINCYEASLTIKNSILTAGRKEGSGTAFYAIWADENAIINIESGTFISKDTNPAVLADASGSISITGGVFSTDPSEYVKAEYTARENTPESGKWTVAKRTASDIDAVAQIGSNYYKSIQDAVSAATTGQTIKLLKDIPLPDNDVFLRFADRVTLDLNSKTINSGVIDEDADWDYLDGYAYVFEGKNLTIQNGTFAGKNTKALPNANYYYGMYLGNDEDGNIETKNITLKNLSFPSGGINIYDAADVFISDCNIVPSGDYYSIFIDNEADYSTTASVTISSGTYGSGNLGKVFDLYGGAVISITGGTYSTDPSEYVAIGYSANKNTETNKWTVVKSTMDNCDLKISKSGETDVYTNLSQFRDSVNAGNSYAGYTITLLRNVDLINVEWTPIGNYSHPFKGVFDGNNKEVKNFKLTDTITEAEAAGAYDVEAADLGLFGFIKGEENTSFTKASDLISDVNTIKITQDAYQLDETNISETKYSCVIKNLTLQNVTISSTYRRYVGALVGQAQNAYISGVIVKCATVSAVKYAGGIIGKSSAIVIKDCSIDNQSQVSTTGHSAGGIISGLNGGNQNNYGCAIINCTNSATVSGNSYVGGVVGHASDVDKLRWVIMNCTNEGTITSGNGLCGGIVGGGGPHGQYCASTEVGFIGYCNNSGTISAGAASYAGGIIGEIFGFIFQCSNTGNVSGTSGKIAGICGGTYCNGDSYLINSVSSGVVTNGKNIIASASGVYVNGSDSSCRFTDNNINSVPGNSID